MNMDADAAKRRQVVEWLNSLFPDLNLPADASSEELRVRLYDDNILCGILNRSTAGFLEIQGGVFLSLEQRPENVKRFLSAVERLGLPGFNVSDLEAGSLAAVVQCLLSLRIHLSSKLGENGVHEPSKMDNQSRRK